MMRIECTHRPGPRPVLARRPRLSAVVCALVVCVLAACGDKSKAGEPAPATDCAAVGETLTRLTTARLDGLSDRQKKLMLAQQHMIKEKTVTTCTAEEWPVSVRACMAGAADIDAFNRCTAPLREAKGLPPPASSAPAAAP